VYRQGCAVVFVLDTNSLRHLFKHAGFPDEAEPVGANVSLRQSQATWITRT
jgi:hypothetical protein